MSKRSFRFKELIGSIFLLFIFLFSGCATLEPDLEYVLTEFPEPERSGIYHKVKPHETLWRIAKTYNVSIDDIIKTNNIPNAAQVEKEQLVFIPGAYTVKEIIIDTDENKNDFIWPVKGKVIHYFKQRYGQQINKGIDIQTTEGQTVVASRTGRVVLADYLMGYGYTIILDHSDGFLSVYAQNAKILVKLGDLVFKHNEISHVAKNGQLAYLHFEIRKNTIEDNPLYYLPKF